LIDISSVVDIHHIIVINIPYFLMGIRKYYNFLVVAISNA